VVYPIVKYPEPVLLKPAERAANFGTPELRTLVEDMFTSMYAANGVGLAAPQIGMGLSIAVVDCSVGEDPAQRIVLINPEIVTADGTQSGDEGCLSLPGFRERVKRANEVTVRAQDVEGQWFERSGTDLLARAFQHEIDHLQGRLFISHVSALKRDLIRRRVKKLRAKGEW
jgi:peptide deformylase